ncbi:hypothetical protein ACN47E_004176 [Coniothyrium glycines]
MSRSLLLQLPREVRDLIYEHVLVRDVIPIEAAVVKIPEATASRSPGYSKNLRELLPCRYSWSHRRLWLIPVLDIVCDFGPSDRTEDPRSTRSVSMTYQLDTWSPMVSPEGPIEIRLLQTCKQVYHEAREIFYGRNIFSFTADFRIATAFAFLCDRPAESLRLISSMELALLEDNNMRATAEAHYPIVRRSTDSLVLQYAYNHFTDLATLLSTPRVQLRKLYLRVQSLASSYDEPPKSFQDCIAWETSKMKDSPWIASWMDPLLKIEGLELVDVCWSFDRPRIRRMLATLSTMRSHMFNKDESEIQTLNEASAGEAIHIQVRYRGDHVCLKHDAAAALAENYVESYSWKAHLLAADGTWQELEEPDARLVTAREQGTPLAQEIITNQHWNYICCSRLTQN